MTSVLSRLETLPILESAAPSSGDWLVDAIPRPARACKTRHAGELVLTNGLISRVFRVVPNGVTVDILNLRSGESLIRGVKPEARVVIDGTEYMIGGATGQPEYAYMLPAWLDTLATDPAAFQLDDMALSPIRERFPWKKTRHVTNSQWPPAGIEASFTYRSDRLPGIDIIVHHEIYDEIPLLCKWLEIRNNSNKAITVDTFTSEVLAMVETTSTPQGNAAKASALVLPPVHVESDYIFGAMSQATGDVTTHWVKDPQYTSQVAYVSDNLVQLESAPPGGAGIIIEPRGLFESFHTWILVHDSTDRERRGLAQRRMYRIIAPWITENPIFMHVTTAEPARVKEAIDQCVETGFEMVILSFGSGFPEIERWIDESEFIAEFKELFDHAHARGIEIGFYSLFSSRTISPGDDVVSPEGKSPTFAHAPCLQSTWGIHYIDAIKKFFDLTGADFLEHDGPYPGDWCASSTHPGHAGHADSQWRQWKAQAGLYKWCRAKGIYINQPDWYFLSGGNKTAMGYKEVNWSLPRERQVIIGRQNIHDGTWDKTPSMGWMFTPLTVYHAFGDHWKESTIEPLSEHIDFYEAHLAQNFLAGVQSCYRGTRLFDTPGTKLVVQKWVSMYKKHRAILESDLIHVRRPDGRHVDGFLHVNPCLKERGLAAFFNPLDEPVDVVIDIPVYYTGIETTARLSEQDGPEQVVPVPRDYKIPLRVKIGPRGRTWFVLR
jgi:hypothetical protein